MYDVSLCLVLHVFTFLDFVSPDLKSRRNVDSGTDDVRRANCKNRKRNADHRRRAGRIRAKCLPFSPVMHEVNSSTVRLSFYDVEMTSPSDNRRRPYHYRGVTAVHAVHNVNIVILLCPCRHAVWQYKGLGIRFILAFSRVLYSRLYVRYWNIVTLSGRQCA